MIWLNAINGKQHAFVFSHLLFPGSILTDFCPGTQQGAGGFKEDEDFSVTDRLSDDGQTFLPSPVDFIDRLVLLQAQVSSQQQDIQSKGKPGRANASACALR